MTIELVSKGSGGGDFPYGITPPSPVPYPFKNSVSNDYRCRPAVDNLAYDYWYTRQYNSSITCYREDDTIQWTYAPSDINAAATRFLFGTWWDTSGSTGEFDQIYVAALDSGTRLYIAKIELNSGTITQVRDDATTMSESTSTSWSISFFGKTLYGTIIAQCSQNDDVSLSYPLDFASMEVLSDSGSITNQLAVGKYCGYINNSVTFFKNGHPIYSDIGRGNGYPFPRSSTSVGVRADVHGDYLIYYQQPVYLVEDMRAYLEAVYDATVGANL